MIPRWYSEPPRPALLGGAEVGEAVRHVDVVDRVVDAAGGAQAEHVPVVDQLGLARPAARRSAARRCPRRCPSVWIHCACLMPEAKLHDPTGGSRRRHHRGARPRALSGDDRETRAAEHLGDGLVGQIGPAGSRGERRGHDDPAVDGSASASVWIDPQRRERVELRSRRAAGHPHAEKAMLVQGVDHRIGELAAASLAALFSRTSGWSSRAAATRSVGRSAPSARPSTEGAVVIDCSSSQCAGTGGDGALGATGRPRAVGQCTTRSAATGQTDTPCAAAAVNSSGTSCPSKR